ncbi:MAG: M20/M25/M40 family metallo-hydrolase [Anaerolineae bacterium]|nr:M20/M25/M40 family metallo-hydrolase [Anaerolineae bacterium]
MTSIRADIETHREAYLARLKDLIRQPSISSQGTGVAETCTKLAGLLEDAGFQVERVPTDGAAVILARMAGDAPQSVLFYNHYDVQPVDPLELWDSPPFEPAQRDGKLYGRGVADNKGDIVARLCAIESTLRTRGRLPVNLVWAIEGEEEIGSLHLHQFVAARQDVLRNVAGCVWEAGGKNARERFEIALGCKGLLYVELVARGADRDLHSALAAIAPSPVWRLLWALAGLKGPDGQVCVPGFLDDVRPISPAQHAALAGWEYPEEENRTLMGLSAFLDDLTGPALKERLIFGPTCNIDGFHAGYGGPGTKTVLPNEARAKLDFRLVPDQRPEHIVECVRAHLDATGFEDVEIAWWEGEAPAAGDPDHPFVQTAARVAGQLYGHPPTLLPMMAGTGPVHLLCDQFDVPVVTAGVGYADSRAHAPNENIRLTDFFEGIEYIAALIEALGENEP